MRILSTIYTVCAITLSGNAMANQEKMGFGMNGFNDIMTSNSIGLDGDKYSLVMRGEVKLDNTMLGVGIFEGYAESETISKFREMRRLVCQTEFPGMHPGNPGRFFASVTCPNGIDKTVAIDVVTAPTEVIGPLLSTTDELIRKFYKEGTATTKLDATISVEPKDGKLLYTVKFRNTGETDISFASPATWEGTYNPRAKDSYASLGGYQEGDKTKNFGSDVGKDQFVNAKDYPNDIVRIPPGQIRYAYFLAYPENRIKKGRYTTSGGAVIKHVFTPEKLKGPVDFMFLEGTTVFEKDYPATKQEHVQFEAYRRTQLFEVVHAVGTTVDETGYYRAYGDYGPDAPRDTTPLLLKKDDAFPPRMIAPLPGSASGIGTPVKVWRWDAFPDSPQ